ncbi:MAG: hypothetical protein ACOCXH_12495 [Cyclobacteriaceae bacterium]
MSGPWIENGSQGTIEIQIPFVVNDIKKNQLPKITLKTNGFALGTIRKGYFKTEKEEIVKLILNSDNKPYILVTKFDGRKFYFSSKDQSNEKLLNEMRKILPNN